MRPMFAEGSPEAQFRHLDHVHRTARDAMLNQAGLGELSQPMILLIIADTPDGVVESQKMLADSLHVTAATITASLKTMERGGYIIRLADERDMRRKRIAITEKGRAAAQTLECVFDRLDRGMYCDFTVQEREQISALFARMIRNLQQISFGEPSAVSEKGGIQSC